MAGLSSKMKKRRGDYEERSRQLAANIQKEKLEINRASPAGNNHKKATKGAPPDSTSGAIAAIAVPHKAKGRTISSQCRIKDIRSISWLFFKIK